LKKNWSIITELRKPWGVMLNIRQIENLKILEVTEEDFERVEGLTVWKP